ncbi:hypothetical protein ACLOJK_020771 [Asimina triloba]
MAAGGGEKGKTAVAGGKESPVVIRVERRDEEGRKRVEKAEVKSHDPGTLRYIERKLRDKGVQRMERHPADGLGLAHLPKSGHGGKYTWEGPDDAVENELYAPPAIDDKDPNYVDEGEGEGEGEGEEGAVVGEVEVAKVAESKKGVAWVEVLPPLQPN